MYPEWLKKYKTKGTSIKEINGSYYLYSVTSKRVKGKDYPTSIQKYIGKITNEGIIKPMKISFIPGIDKIIYLGDELNIDSKNKRRLNKIAAIKQDDIFYVGKLNNSEIALIKKYYAYDNGKVYKN